VTPGAEALLVRRGVPVVPDFVANAGAAAWAWWVIFGLVADAESSRAMVSAHVRPLVARLMAAWNADRTDLRSHARDLAVQSSTALTSRFGSVTELVPLFDAGPLAAQARVPQPVSTTDRGRP
jgi:glutamate dehydrogenase (NAD(P)+)